MLGLEKRFWGYSFFIVFFYPTPSRGLFCAPEKRLQAREFRRQAGAQTLTHDRLRRSLRILAHKFSKRLIHFVQTLSIFCGHDLCFYDILLKYRTI